MTERHILTPNQRLTTKKGILSKWTYLRDIEYKKYGKSIKRIVEVRCECGTIKNVQYNNIRGGGSLCCGNNLCKIPYNKNNRSIDASYNSLFYAYKTGAKKRGYSFELTVDDFKYFLDKNCFYCNDVPSSIYRILDSKTGEIRSGIPLTYNGIDRMDNSVGYTKTNCITCCKTCNQMKMDSNYNFFLDHINKIYKNKYECNNTL